MLITAFVLGLLGSAGHCVGMCSGVTLILTRAGILPGWRLIVAHIGRVTTYALLGTVAGSTGFMVGQMAHQGQGTAATSMTSFNLLQGIMAFLAGGTALYMALALLGYLPSPERFLVKLTRRWGQGMRSLGARDFGMFSPLVAGLLWGLLPCGLVMTALLSAAITATPLQGALVMVLFGVGTWPLLIGVGIAGQNWQLDANGRLRTVAAFVVMAFGLQLALRGFAALGLVQHLHIGGVMLW